MLLSIFKNFPTFLEIAFKARSFDNLILPAAKFSVLIFPITTSASVIVASSPPLA